MIERWACCEKNLGERGRRATPNPFAGIKFRVALLSLLVWIAACQEQIVHDLSEREANSVISQLSMAGLESRKVQQPDGRWAISVDSDEMIPALSFIETRRVLPSRDATASSTKGSMLPSREEQWFRYERSVAVSIEESLSALPGVLDARVHVNLPDDDPLFGDSARKGGSGSVLVVVDGGFGTTDDEVAALVGGAAGLPREVVRVLKTQAVRAPIPDDADNSTAVSLSSSESRVSRATWFLGAVLVGATGAAITGIAWGARALRRRPKRRVTFELPRELDFEG